MRGAGKASALRMRGAKNTFQSTKPMTSSASTSKKRPHVSHAGLRIATSLRNEHRRDSLSAADAGRRDTVSAAAFTQVVQCRERETRAGCAERMTERDRAAVWVEAYAV